MMKAEKVLPCKNGGADGNSGIINNTLKTLKRSPIQTQNNTQYHFSRFIP